MSQLCAYDKNCDSYIFSCPHCHQGVIVYSNEIKCSIFRHGFNIRTQQQIHPHGSKSECDRLALLPDIVGCCKPFKMIHISDTQYRVEACDYV